LAYIPRSVGGICRARAAVESLYCRGSHYFLTPEADGPVDRKRPTQVGRALAQLGIDHIAAYSPQARRDVYLAAHNARFAVKAEQEGSAFVAIAGMDLSEILCIQEERQVGNDNTVAFQRHRLQIPPSRLRAHFVKARVKVRQYHDGTHAIFYGPRCLGRYDAGGALIVEPSRAA
jgi:hypothetical protein